MHTIPIRTGMYTYICVCSHTTVYVLAQVHVVSLCVAVCKMYACVYAHEYLVILYMCHVALDYVLPHIHVYTVFSGALCTTCTVWGNLCHLAMQIWLRDCNEEDVANNISYYDMAFAPVIMITLLL